MMFIHIKRLAHRNICIFRYALKASTSLPCPTLFSFPSFPLLLPSPSISTLPQTTPSLPSSPLRRSVALSLNLPPSLLSSPLSRFLAFPTLTSAQICHKVHGALAEEHVLQFDDVRVIHALQYRNLRVKFPEVVWRHSVYIHNLHGSFISCKSVCGEVHRTVWPFA